MHLRLYDIEKIYDKILNTDGRIYYNEYKEIDFTNLIVKDISVYGGVAI